MCMLGSCGMESTTHTLAWVVSVEFSSCEEKEPRYPVNLPKDNDLGVAYL